MKLEGASTGLPRAPIDELSRVVSSRRRPADQLALCRAGSVQLALCSEPRAQSAILRAQSSELPHRRDSVSVLCSNRCFAGTASLKTTRAGLIAKLAAIPSSRKGVA